MIILYAEILIQSNKGDRISLFVDKPAPFGDGMPEHLVLEFDTPKGMAGKYLADHFPEVTLRHVMNVERVRDPDDYLGPGHV